ncbi:hypothetical protein LI036_03120 [bacterium 210917-DFI.7.65]|nr:hypothetical protein [bacterium 210917-DFI.7.65]
MKKKWIVRAACVAAVCALTVTGVAAAGSAGTSEDPLITYSYLNDTFKKEVLSEANGGFVLVTLSSGQTLKGEVGTEVMLRVGTASCAASSAPGLIDTTTAGVIDHGAALTKNHLYMMTIEDRGVKATAATVKMLVRGSYTIS